MELVATYFDPHTLGLAEGAFRKVGIPYALRKVEGEIDDTELLVDAPDYDRACQLAEQLDRFLLDKADAEQRTKICPNCKCSEFRWCSEAHTEESIMGISYVYQCTRCGHIMPV